MTDRLAEIEGRIDAEPVDLSKLTRTELCDLCRDIDRDRVYLIARVRELAAAVVGDQCLQEFAAAEERAVTAYMHEEERFPTDAFCDMVCANAALRGFLKDMADSDAALGAKGEE